MIRRIIKSIPNTITCLNLVSGALACILALQFDADLCGLKAYEWAFVCIGASAIFDFCDGAAARLLKAYSDLGKELDSLSDLVSFGLAPTMLVYSAINYLNVGFTWWSLMSLFIVVMGALRLAKFNIDTRQTTSFIGLPIPANAILWIGTVSFCMQHSVSPWVLVVLALPLALLMVSSMRMFSLKFKNFDWRENFRRYVIILAAVLFVATNGLPGLAWTIVLYILISAVGRKEA